jgi:hypothetical protein
VARRFGCRVKAVLAAGLPDLSGDDKTIATLARSGAERIVLALPEGQQPTVEVLRFLRSVRSRRGAPCQLVVGLLAEAGDRYQDVDPDEIESWRRYLLAEADPYLSL